MKKKTTLGATDMRKEYDFSKGVRNPYIKKLKKEIRLSVQNETLEYFKSLASETGIPYQRLIDLFLQQCAENRMTPSFFTKRPNVQS